VRLDDEQIRNLLAVASLPASGSTFFEDVEAFRSIMEYFGYEEGALKGFSDSLHIHDLPLLQGPRGEGQCRAERFTYKEKYASRLEKISG